MDFRFHLHYTAENPHPLFFSFISSHKCNFIFVAIFVYGRKWNIIFGPCVVDTWCKRYNQSTTRADQVKGRQRRIDHEGPVHTAAIWNNLLCYGDTFGIKLGQLLNGEDDRQATVRQLTQSIATKVQRSKQVVWRQPRHFYEINDLRKQQ